MLKTIVDKIVSQKSKKRIAIVLKGFSDEEMLPIENKLFSKWHNLKFDSENIENLKANILPQVIESQIKDSDYFWLTFEEYIIAVDQIKYICDIKIVENNLYNNQYPYQNTLSNIEDIYKDFYLNVDDQIKGDKQGIFDNVASYYGDINFSMESGNYYITYSDVEIPKDSINNVFSVTSHKVELEEFEKNTNPNVIDLELTEDETVFLDLIDELSIKDNIEKVRFIVTSDVDSLPNNYRERIEILQSVYKDKIYFSFLTKSIETIDISNLEEYEDILMKYWKYPSFRDLKMYKDIDSKGKEIIAISQAQIIDDIVKQAEAAVSDSDYRDIYITSSTGSGKSIMFQIPSLYLAKKYPENKPLSIVIAPLIGLMNDQVDSMRARGIDTVQTIHSNTSPFEREKILNKIADGTVTMLYLSPETLQARSDIKMLIGDRKIGLVIIDEAHIVTTWGKTFRADYWYLGIYLQKLRKEYNFPIVTFTATAIYGGKEDMYLDTRDSLNMVNPIAYFGYVKRNDIFLHVQSSEKIYETAGRDYRKTKNQLALEHLRKSFTMNEKSLIYFPTVKLLEMFYGHLRVNAPEIFAKTGQYHGSMKKEEKNEVLDSYKKGELRFVLATKAFGMGIDIPDIHNVYHYTPTGSVTDYIQEVGRVARDKKMLKENNPANEVGHAWFDFLKNDFVEVNKLQGMSAIRKTQIIEVMKKILSIYQDKGNNRNLIVSADDFRYIFIDSQEDMDNKIKTIMLMIEKDFASPENIGYSPFVARPRSLFGNEMIFVNNEFKKTIHKHILKEHFTHIGELSNSKFDSVFNVDLAGIWEAYYKDMSFPQFKYRLFKEEERSKLKHHDLFDQFVFTTGISIPQKTKTEFADVMVTYNKYLNAFESFSVTKKREGSYFSVPELGRYLQNKLRLQDKFQARAIALALINSSFEYSKLKNYKFIKERASRTDSKFNYVASFDMYFQFMKQHLKKIYTDKERYIENKENLTLYHYRNKYNDRIDSDLIVLGISETLGLITYEVVGGNNPQIYIRMNSVYPLEKAIKQGQYYQNRLLNDVRLKHKISVSMLTYLFKYKPVGNKKSEKVRDYTLFFWDKIEDYFLGKIPEEVQNEVFSGTKAKAPDSEDELKTEVLTSNDGITIIAKGEDVPSLYSTWNELIESGLEVSEKYMSNGWNLPDYIEGEISIDSSAYEFKYYWEKQKRVVFYSDSKPDHLKNENGWNFIVEYD